MYLLGQVERRLIQAMELQGVILHFFSTKLLAVVVERLELGALAEMGLLEDLEVEAHLGK
jgi:hypothetical protein